MKRFIVVVSLALSMIIFLILKGHSQPNLGLFATNKGVGASIGLVAGNIALNASYKAPLFNRDVPTIANLAIGYQRNITNNDADNFTVTPFLGIGNYRVKDFTAYDADPTGKTAIVSINQYKPYYAIEIAKDWYLGRLFVSANYCGGFYAGIGMKFFTNR